MSFHCLRPDFVKEAAVNQSSMFAVCVWESLSVYSPPTISIAQIVLGWGHTSPYCPKRPVCCGCASLSFCAPMVHCSTSINLNAECVACSTDKLIFDSKVECIPELIYPYLQSLCNSNDILSSLLFSVFSVFYSYLMHTSIIDNLSIM